MSCGGASESKWVDKRIKWHVGEGNQARFWLDNWGMNLLLRTNYQYGDLEGWLLGVESRVKERYV